MTHLRGKIPLLIYVISYVAFAVASQLPIFASEENPPESYVFEWPIHKVAIIGAGPGGLMTYRELADSGFEVHMFERDNLPGGNWHYTEEIPVDAPIPNAEISVGDYVPSLPPKGVEFPYEEHYHGGESDEMFRLHRAPKPIWETLHSNTPAPVQQITEFPWPVGTPWELPHSKLTTYIRAFSSYHGVNSNDGNYRVSYNTRVELVERRFNEKAERAGWTLTLKQLVRTEANSSKAIWMTEDFDAVVVASGRYNAPNIPDIPGLEAWAERFSDQITHSRQYRHPEPYTNKTVLVVGAASSGVEISRDVISHVRKIYQSVRPANSTVSRLQLRLNLGRSPSNVTIVPEIKRFLPPTMNINTSGVELVNGSVLTGIDSIIFATGFRYTFPFLPQYHNSSIGLEEVGPSYLPQPIVTDGTHLRNLYLDLFYIEEPTLGFINMNVGMQSFTYAEYLALALCKVWSNKAKLPSTRDMLRLTEKHVEELGGYGKHLQFLGTQGADRMVRLFVGWLNAAAAKYGGRQVAGLSPESAQINRIWTIARYGGDILATPEKRMISSVADVAFDNMFLNGEDHIIQLEDVLYSDYW